MFEQFHTAGDPAPPHTGPTHGTVSQPPTIQTAAPSASLSETVNTLAMTMLLNMQNNLIGSGHQVAALAPDPAPAPAPRAAGRSGPSAATADTSLSVARMSYKLITTFLEELSDRFPVRRQAFMQLGNVLNTKAFYHINEIYKFNQTYFMAEPYGLVEGNARFLVKALKEEMQRANDRFIFGDA